MVGSLLCGWPVQEHIAEWEHSFRQVYGAVDAVEIDFSPTTRLGSDDLVTQTLRATEVGKSVASGDQQCIPKLNHALSSQLAQFLERAVLLQGGPGPFHCTAFNRPLTLLHSAHDPLPRVAAYGGSALLLGNLGVMAGVFGLSSSLWEKVIMSYSGGIADGFDAVHLLSAIPATSIQVASALMGTGGAWALGHLLGTLAIRLVILQQQVAPLGIDVGGVRDLWRLVHHPEIQVALAAPGDQRPRVAVVDPAICPGTCIATGVLGPTICAAGEVCPQLAIQRPRIGEKAVVDRAACIGCQNCEHHCPFGAITWEVRPDD
jgi:NAD-dependent dihydropyrimidine dehydrogenase PreA subunit